MRKFSRNRLSPNYGLELEYLEYESGIFTTKTLCWLRLWSVSGRYTVRISDRTLFTSRNVRRKCNKHIDKT